MVGGEKKGFSEPEGETSPHRYGRELAGKRAPEPAGSLRLTLSRYNIRSLSGILKGPSSDFGVTPVNVS